MGTLSPTRRGSSEIVFTLSDGSKLRLHVFRDKSHRIKARRRAAPAEEGQQSRYQETSKTWRDWWRGAGFEVADEGTDGGYGFGSFLDSERRGLLGPAGYVEELDIPPGVVTRFNRSEQIGGHLFYTTLGTGLLKVPNLTDTPVDAGIVMASGVSQDLVIFRDAMWIANAGNARIYSFDGTTATIAPDNVRRSRFCTTNWVLGASMSGGGMSTGVPYRVLISSAAGTSEIYHCTGDPGVAANHAGPNPVGDSVYGIQKLVGTVEAAFALKPDGAYMIQGGGRMPNLTPWWGTDYDASNGSTAEFFDGELFAGTVQTWQMISADTSNLGQMVECQPGAGESHETSPVFGRATASTQYDGKKVVSFYNGSKSYVMHGRRAARLGVNNRNPIIWHGPVFECAGAIRDIRLVVPADPTYPRFVYYATDDQSGVPHLFRQDVPREPSAYSSYRRGGVWRAYPTWSATMSAEDLGDPDSPKVMRFYGCVAENLGDGNSVTISTNTDVATDDVEQATLITSPRDYAVAETTTARGHLVTVRADVVNDPERPVFIRAAKMRGTINDEKTTVVTVPVELGRDVRGANGQMDPRDQSVNAQLLYSLLEAGPLELQDWMGRDATVVLEDIEEQEVEDTDRKGVTRVANLTYSILLTASRYGASIYGSGRFS